MTMNVLSDQVATAAPTEILPADTVELLEVTTPETPEGEQEQPELSEADKKLADAEKAQKAMKRRIDRLTREKYEARAQLDQVRQQRPAAQDEPAEGAKTPTQQEIQQQARVLVEMERTAAKCNDVHTAGTKAFPDFLDKFKELHDEVPLFDPQQRPTTVMEAILDSDNPSALIHHLGSDPDLAAELADMTPRQQIRRIALIERDMGETSKPKASAAPKPLSPVRAGASKGAVDPSDTKRWIEEQNRLDAAGR